MGAAVATDAPAGQASGANVPDGPLATGALPGAALFGFNELSNAQMHRRANRCAEVRRLQAPDVNAAMDQAPQWNERAAVSAGVTAFIDQRLAAMNLSTLDGLVVIAAEAHDSKGCVVVLDAAMRDLRGRAGQGPQPLGLNYLSEEQPHVMPRLEQRARDLRVMLDATPESPRLAAGLLALEVASSPHEVHQQRTLKATKVAAAQGNGMRVAGFDGDRAPFGHLPVERREAEIDHQMAVNIWRHVQQHRGVSIVSMGADHLGTVLGTLSRVTPVIGLCPVGDRTPQQNAFVLSNDDVLAYRLSPALESAWLEVPSAQHAGALPAGAPSGAPDPQAAVDASGRLRGTTDSAQRTQLLQRIQQALAHPGLARPAHAAMFSGLVQALDQQGQATLDEHQTAWTRRLCDALLYESPPATAPERAAAAKGLASAIHGEPPIHGESVCTSAWAVARLKKLASASGGFGTGREAVLRDVMSALLRRPRFLDAQGTSKADLVDLVRQLMTARHDAQSRAVAGRLRDDPRMAGYLGPELHLKLQFALSNVPQP